MLNRREVLKGITLAALFPSLGIKRIGGLVSAQGGVVSLGSTAGLLSNPGYILYDLVKKWIPDDKIDHKAFENLIKDCSIEIDTGDIPTTSSIDAIVFLGQETKHVVWFDGSDRGKMSVMPERKAKDLFDKDGHRYA